jgi:hypothetical protein
LPVTNTNGLPRCARRTTLAQRRSAVGQVAHEEHRRRAPRREHVEAERVVVQVRGDGDHRLPGQRRLPGDDEPREADELRVELLVERAGRAADRLDRLQRAWDVRPVGVVLRLSIGALGGISAIIAAPMPSAPRTAPALVQRSRGRRASGSRTPPAGPSACAASTTARSASSDRAIASRAWERARSRFSGLAPGEARGDGG